MIFPTPELAIEAACTLIDRGHDVYGIGIGPRTDQIKRELIERIYALWARPRNPFDSTPSPKPRIATAKQ